ncbi:MAG: ABC transporter ATP-binding protein [Aridibacter sp.]
MSLKIKNFSKKYNDAWILKDVSLEIRSCEILGLFGASGSGKSVLIRLISGLETANNGQIFMLDDDITNDPCEDRGFSFPSLSNEAFWKKVFADGKSSELAEGEGQMLALDFALQEVNGVLLLDNSFCQMDRRERTIAYEKLIKATKERNLVVLFATNDYEEIFTVCDRVAILHEGEVQQVGTPEEVYLEPHSKAVAENFGDNNVFPARRLNPDSNETPEFKTLDGEHHLLTGKIPKDKVETIGQEVNLSIRPEHISISFGASFPEDNLIKAKIVGIRFKGATTKIYLDANGLLLKTLVLRLVGLNIGDECMVGLPPDRIQVFEG